jgi:molybdopterin molybdotransferase
MLEVEDALARIISLIPTCPSETLALDQVLGRVAAQRIEARVALPTFDNSAMDGFALRSTDVQQATFDQPVILKCIGTIPAGARNPGTIERGDCLRIFTGAPMPEGADAVVMQEDTQRVEELVHILDPVKPWENVRLRGEDIKEGTLLAESGQELTPGRLSLLAATGVQQVAVTARPLVGILSTGSELIANGPLSPGQIYESNRASIGALLTRAGAKVRVYPLVADSLLETRSALKTALTECDCVVTTGGVSVGEHDLLKEAFDSLGGILEFWRVAMKPGKPFVFGRWQDKFLFGLPGNPVSAFVTCLVLVGPAVFQFLGAKTSFLRNQTAVLSENMINRGDRRHYVRVVIDSHGKARSAGLQASHALNSLANANALLPVPPHTEWQAGQQVTVMRWEL